MLFSRRAIVKTLMRSLKDVRVEVGGQTGLKLRHRVTLVEIGILSLDAAP